MDLADILRSYIVPIVSVGTMLLNVIIIMDQRLLRRTAATATRVDAIEKRNEETAVSLAGRLATLEAAVRHAPTHQDLDHLTAKMNTISEQLCHLIGENESQMNLLRMLLSRELGPKA